MAFLVNVGDLLVDPGSSRDESATFPLTISLSNAVVDGPAAVRVQMRSLTDGIVVRGEAEIEALLTCNRCLTPWNETRTVAFEQVYRRVPGDEDDEMPLVDGHSIDLEPAVHDEVSLALPVAPTCRPDCAGLCGVCGTDLNVDSCDGHDDGADSPFAALKQLFDS